MRRKLLICASLLIVSVSTFAGGILTNTNQHPAFLRMLSRGATFDIDAVISNPAGLAFMPKDGFYCSLSIQSAFQTRNIDANYYTYTGFNGTAPIVSDQPYHKYYEGKAAAPIIPSVFGAYKKGDWVISCYFGVTGGGGKASFDDGLPMFESLAMAGIFKAGLQQGKVLTQEIYDINSAMEGKQFIYSVQLGLTYKINEWLSAFAGGRMNYFTGGYTGYLTANLKESLGGAQLMNLALDCDQTGWGLTPVIGLDAKLGRLNIGAKYEFKTNLNIENNTKENTDPDGALAAFKHGVNTPSDIPSLLSLAAGYQFLPNLRASVEYHFYDDKQAGMANDKQKYLTKGTNEYLAGIEWDVTQRLTLSCGGQITDYGLSDNYQSDTSFSCDSYSLGFGAKLKLTEKADINIGYMWTTYDDYKKVSDNYNGTGLKGSNVYSRTNKVFGMSIDYKF